MNRLYIYTMLLVCFTFINLNGLISSNYNLHYEEIDIFVSYELTNESNIVHLSISIYNKSDRPIFIPMDLKKEDTIKLLFNGKSKNLDFGFKNFKRLNGDTQNNGNYKFGKILSNERKITDFKIMYDKKKFKEIQSKHHFLYIEYFIYSEVIDELLKSSTKTTNIVKNNVEKFSTSKRIIKIPFKFRNENDVNKF